MKYTLHITKQQPDHLGETPPVQEYADRFDTPQAAADFAEAMIAEYEAPTGAWSYDVLDENRAPVEGYSDRQP